jgi:hypothetical protein
VGVGLRGRNYSHRQFGRASFEYAIINIGEIDGTIHFYILLTVHHVMFLGK